MQKVVGNCLLRIRVAFLQILSCEMIDDLKITSFYILQLFYSMKQKYDNETLCA